MIDASLKIGTENPTTHADNQIISFKRSLTNVSISFL